MLTNVNAFGQDSSITAGKDVTLKAEDGTQITATVITVAVSATDRPEQRIGLPRRVVQREPGRLQPGRHRGPGGGPCLPGQHQRVGRRRSDVWTPARRGCRSIPPSLPAPSPWRGARSNAFSLGGSGVYADNQIALDVEAYLRQRPHPRQRRQRFHHRQRYLVDQRHGRGRVAGRIRSATTAVAVAIGLSLATNEIDNVVQAYIANVPAVTTTSGGISRDVHGERHDRRRVGGGGAGRGRRRGNGVAISGAAPRRPTPSWARTTPTSAPATSTARAASPSTRRMLPRSRPTIIAAAVSLGIGISDGAVGASIGIAVARNFIGNSVDSSPPYDHLTSDNVLTLNPGDTVKIAAAPAPATSTSTWAQPVTVAVRLHRRHQQPSGGQARPERRGPGRHGRRDLEFGLPVRRHAHLSNPDLTTQNYSDPTLWHQVTALQQDYSNSALWRQVNLNSDPLQVQAYVLNSGVNAATSYTVTANSTPEHQRPGPGDFGRGGRQRRYRRGRQRIGRLRREPDLDGCAGVSTTAAAGTGAGINGRPASASAHSDTSTIIANAVAASVAADAGRRRGRLGVHRPVDRAEPDRQRRRGVHRQRGDRRDHHVRGGISLSQGRRRHPRGLGGGVAGGGRSARSAWPSAAPVPMRPTSSSAWTTPTSPTATSPSARTTITHRRRGQVQITAEILSVAVGIGIGSGGVGAGDRRLRGRELHRLRPERQPVCRCR